MSETRSLHKKLAEVQATVERVAKRGRNDFHKYDYATEADIVDAVRGALSERRVTLIPSVTEVRRDGNQTIAMMTFTFSDGESGEALTVGWAGSGEDKGDKGLYKAMTGALKYFLLKTFLIPTGDDPEREEGGRSQRTSTKRGSFGGPVSAARPIVERELGRLVAEVVPGAARNGAGMPAPDPLGDTKTEHKRAFALMEKYGWDISPKGQDERHKLYSRATGLTIDSADKARFLSAKDWRAISDLLKQENEPPLIPA